jgi:hypothetical protein
MKYIVLFLVLFFSSCGSEKQWSQSIQDQFVSRCVYSLATLDQCECLMNGLQGRYTEDEMDAIVSHYNATGIWPEEFVQIVDQCL